MPFISLLLHLIVTLNHFNAIAQNVQIGERKIVDDSVPPLNQCVIPKLQSTYCADVVKYPAFLSSKSNITHLYALVADRAIYADESFNNKTCRQIIKRLLCTSIFLKCSQTRATDSSTNLKSFGTYPDGQYLSPCRSLCSQAAQCVVNTTMISPYCAVATFSSSKQFSNVSMSSEEQCNNGDAEEVGRVNLVQFGSNNMPTCDGINRSTYHTSNLVEATSYLLRNRISAYATVECTLNYRKLICNSFSLNSSTSFILYMREVCSQFTATCSPPWFQNYRELLIKCNDLTGQSLRLETSLLSLDTDSKFVPQALVNVSSSSSSSSSLESLNLSSSSVVAECPYGLVVPADSSKSILRIPNSLCAVPCPIPTYTKSEMRKLLDNTFNAACVCVAFGVFMLINIHQLKESKRNFYVKIQVYLVIAHNGFLVLRFALIPDIQHLLCDTNASWHSVHDGIKSASGYGCLISGIYIVIEAFVIYWSFMAMSTELWLVVVFSSKRNIGTFKTYLFYGSILYFVGHWALTIGYGRPNVLVPGATTVNCWFLDDKDYFWEFFLPCTIYTIISMILCLHVLCICLTTAWRVRKIVGGSSFLSNLWKSYSMLIKVLILYWVQFVPLTFDLLFITAIKSNYVVPKGTEDWFSCLMLHFKDSVSTPDEFMISKCGAHPADRIPYSSFSLPFIADYIWALCVFIVTFNSEARAFWLKLFFRITYNLCGYSPLSSSGSAAQIYDSDVKNNNVTDITYSTTDETNREATDIDMMMDSP